MGIEAFGDLILLSIRVFFKKFTDSFGLLILTILSEIFF